MTTTVTTTGITFNDATVQTTAASASAYVGLRSQSFTSSGTFTVPTGVTSAKVTICGGGGGGTQGGNGGSSGAGGSSSFGSSITVTGGGGTSAGATGSYGTANAGSYSTTGLSPLNTFANYGQGSRGTTICCSQGGTGGTSYTAVYYATGLTPGGTVSITVGALGTNNGSASAGYKGYCLIEY